jgi:hypothetical protein
MGKRRRRLSPAELREIVGCEHLHGPWEVSGRSYGSRGKIVRLLWSRTCELCQDIELISAGPKSTPRDLPGEGLEWMRL